MTPPISFTIFPRIATYRLPCSCSPRSPSCSGTCCASSWAAATRNPSLRTGARAIATRAPRSKRASLQLSRSAHVGRKHGRNDDTAILLLIILQDGDERASDGDAGPVQRVHRLRLAGDRVAPSRQQAARL